MPYLRLHVILRGNPSNHQRYRNVTLCAYGFPTTVVILTMIAEGTLPGCHKYKPRIGEIGNCYFTGNYKLLSHPIVTYCSSFGLI